MKKIIFLTLIAISLFSCSVSEQTLQRRAERKALLAQTIRQQVADKQFKVKVRQAYPLGGAPIMLSTTYYLHVVGDSISSYLPYFGRAFSVPYGGGKGLNFEATIAEYQQVWVDDHQARIDMRVVNEEDDYQYTVEIFDNGPAYIRVSSHNRQAISFSGEVETEP